MNSLTNELQAGIQILWYQVHSVLGRGGFGITYLAEDTNLGQMVAIKEYLPHDYASRENDSTVQPISIDHDEVYAWGLERFMSEAQTLAKFKHDNVVRVLSVFKQNNTGYMVMEYEQGRDLGVVYEEKKRFTQIELEKIYLPIMDGLKSVHAEGFIHRDIKPSNIYIRENGSPVLIDFGAARHAVGGKTRTLTAMLSVGYAPFEQYNENSGKQGPWTDIYALGASMFQGITGEKPLESTMRGMALVHHEADPYYPLSFTTRSDFSIDFLRAIDGALMLQVNDRPQSIDEFVGMLKGDISLIKLQPSEYVNPHSSKTVVRPVNKKSVDKEAKQKPKVNNLWPTNLVDNLKEKTSTRDFIKLISIVAGIAIAALVGFMLFQSELSPEEKQKQQITLLLEKAGEYIKSENYYRENEDSAVSIYDDVLSIDPENAAAIEGQNKIGTFYLDSAKWAIGQKKFDSAKTHLFIVSTIDPEFSGLKEMRNKVSIAIGKEKLRLQVSNYLDEAKKARANGQVYEPFDKSAYDFYNKVLKIDLGNTKANSGLKNIAKTIVLDAETALKQNNPKKAESLLGLAERIKPDTPGIKNIRQQINNSTELEKLIARADAAYARKRYTKPKSENAVELYRKITKLSPGNSHAIKRLKNITDFYAKRVHDNTRAEKFQTAKFNLGILTSIFPGYSANAILKAELERAKNNKQPPASIRHLLPVGINQNQPNEKVIDDIQVKFVNAFSQKDLARIKAVAQIDSNTEAFFIQIFNFYKNVEIDVVTTTSKRGNASSSAEIKLQIVRLIDQKGKQVESKANWTRLQLGLVKKNGYWYKANLGNW